ncbi:MAG: hypothetical protein ACREE7_05765, partial [Dongiaceae bacterium]
LEDRNALFVTIDVATAVGGVWLMSAAMVGYMLRPLGLPMRGLVFLAGVMLLLPYKVAPGGHWTNAAGAVLAIVVLALEVLAARRVSAA